MIRLAEKFQDLFLSCYNPNYHHLPPKSSKSSCSTNSCKWILSFIWRIQAPCRDRLRLLSLFSVILKHVPYFETDSVTCYKRTMPVFKFKHVPECAWMPSQTWPKSLSCVRFELIKNKLSLLIFFLFTQLSVNQGRMLWLKIFSFTTKDSKLTRVHLLCGLWARLLQPLFYELCLWYLSSLHNVKTSVNDQGMTSNYKTCQRQCFPFKLWVLFWLVHLWCCRGCSCAMLNLLLGITQWAELSHIGATVVDMPTVKGDLSNWILCRLILISLIK